MDSILNLSNLNIEKTNINEKVLNFINEILEVNY